jgi:ribonuclease Z
MITFNLQILGTSSALPTSERYNTAQVLNVRERFFLIDCGEGTQIQMRKFKVKTSRINHIFISHMHGDHYYGLIGLITSIVLLGRNTNLHIYSHSELPILLKAQLDIIMSEANFELIWHPLSFKSPQLIYADEAVQVTSFPLKHRVPCCGFLFEEMPCELNIRKSAIEKYNIPVRDFHKIKKGEDFVDNNEKIIPNSKITLPAYIPRKYAFCTDTVFMPELKNLLNNVDLLYHEATFGNAHKKRAAQTFHSTASEAASLAKMANAKKLLIGHFSSRYSNIKDLENEARSIFENTVAVNDGDMFSVVQQRSGK